MNDAVYQMMSDALRTGIVVIGPLLAVGALAGIIVSAFLAMTSIKDQAAAYAFKLLAVFFLLYFMFPLISEFILSLFVQSLT